MYRLPCIAGGWLSSRGAGTPGYEEKLPVVEPSCARGSVESSNIIWRGRSLCNNGLVFIDKSTNKVITVCVMTEIVTI